MKWWPFILVLLSNFITPIGAEASDVARITACDYPPYEFEHPDGDKRGFDVEVVEEAFRRVGLPAVFEFYPWARALQMTKDGEVTALLSCVDTLERRSFLIMSEPISASTRIFLVRKEYDGPSFTSYENLGGLNIGAVKGYVSSGDLTRHGIQHDLSVTDAAALKKLAKGRIDVLNTTLERSQYLIDRLDMKGRFKWFVQFKKDYHLCFSKNRPGVKELIVRFNTVLKSIKEDGTYGRIHNKYR